MATSESSQQILNAFRSLVKALRMANRAGLQRYEIGSAQIYLLHQLLQSSPLTINELAARTATDQSTVSVVVDKLVEKELVTRQRSSVDARRAEVVITPRGRSVAKKLPPPFQEEFLKALDQLPAAHRRIVASSLLTVLAKMGLEEERPPMLMEDSAAKRRARSVKKKR